MVYGTYSNVTQSSNYWHITHTDTHTHANGLISDINKTNVHK